MLYRLEWNVSEAQRRNNPEEIHHTFTSHRQLQCLKKNENEGEANCAIYYSLRGYVISALFCLLE